MIIYPFEIHRTVSIVNYLLLHRKLGTNDISRISRDIHLAILRIQVPGLRVENERDNCSFGHSA